jgi:hypothetical protein
MWKEAVVANSKKLFQHWPEGTEDNLEDISVRTARIPILKYKYFQRKMLLRSVCVWVNHVIPPV